MCLHVYIPNVATQNKTTPAVKGTKRVKKAELRVKKAELQAKLQAKPAVALAKKVSFESTKSAVVPAKSAKSTSSQVYFVFVCLSV